MDYQKAKLEEIQRTLTTSTQACSQAVSLVSRILEVAQDERVPVDLLDLVVKNEPEFAAMLEHIRSCMEGLPVQLAVKNPPETDEGIGHG